MAGKSDSTTGRVRPYSPGDAATLIAEGLRESDRREIAGLGHDPDSALLWSVEVAGNDTFTVTADDVPCAVFGVSPLTTLSMPGAGAPWFLASDRIYTVGRQFATQTFAWVEWMNRVYPYLFNYTDAENRVTRLWLHKAGFTLHDPKPIGVNGKLYIPFSRHRS